jgi:hypothetical protein
VDCGADLPHRQASARQPAALGRSAAWLEIIADLESLTETELEHDGKVFVVRSTPRPPPASLCAPPASPSR